MRWASVPTYLSWQRVSSVPYLNNMFLAGLLLGGPLHWAASQIHGKLRLRLVTAKLLKSMVGKWHQSWFSNIRTKCGGVLLFLEDFSVKRRVGSSWKQGIVIQNSFPKCSLWFVDKYCCQRFHIFKWRKPLFGTHTSVTTALVLWYRGGKNTVNSCCYSCYGDKQMLSPGNISHLDYIHAGFPYCLGTRDFNT